MKPGTTLARRPGTQSVFQFIAKKATHVFSHQPSCLHGLLRCIQVHLGHLVPVEGNHNATIYKDIPVLEGPLMVWWSAVHIHWPNKQNINFNHSKPDQDKWVTVKMNKYIQIHGGMKVTRSNTHWSFFVLQVSYLTPPAPIKSHH